MTKDLWFHLCRMENAWQFSPPPSVTTTDVDRNETNDNNSGGRSVTWPRRLRASDTDEGWRHRSRVRLTFCEERGRQAFWCVQLDRMIVTTTAGLTADWSYLLTLAVCQTAPAARGAIPRLFRRRQLQCSTEASCLESLQGKGLVHAR